MRLGVIIILAATVVGATAAVVAFPVAAGEAPGRELERDVRELEATVRAIHAARLGAARQRERSSEMASRFDAESRDLEREAAGAESDLAVLRETVARLSRDRDDLVRRESAVKTTREALLASITSSAPAASGASLAERLADAARRLEGREDAARASGVDATGTVELGALGRFSRDSDVSRQLREQPGSPVRVPVGSQERGR
jgi:chromosome segregation ATPase